MIKKKIRSPRHCVQIRDLTVSHGERYNLNRNADIDENLWLGKKGNNVNYLHIIIKLLHNNSKQKTTLGVARLTAVVACN